MNAALACLLILTVHRCYPAGVPRFLQGDLIRRQIRNYPQTLCVLWAFAILINLPLFSLTKYENNSLNLSFTVDNQTTIVYSINEPNCYTDAEKLWPKIYVTSLLVVTYVITGTFLIVIYGQVIRIILASKRYTDKSLSTVNSRSTPSDSYRYLSPNRIHHDRFRAGTGLIQREENQGHQSSSSSSPASNSTNRREKRNSSLATQRQTLETRDVRRTSVNNSHSGQHVQIIVMLFIVILLYILLLLPYRLFNVLYIVHNQMFQMRFMNEILFECFMNVVRLLVFINCALQPITYLIISSRLRQTVLKFLRSLCCCSWSFERNDKRVRAYFTRNNRHTPINYPIENFPRQRETRPIQTSLNNFHRISLQSTPLKTPLNPVAAVQLVQYRPTQKTLYSVSFMNRPQK